jgi:hypothetical protein
MLWEDGFLQSKSQLRSNNAKSSDSSFSRGCPLVAAIAGSQLLCTGLWGGQDEGGQVEKR